MDIGSVLDAKHLHWPNYLDGHKFYPYANAEIYWEAFEADDLIQFAKQAGLEVILCEKGNIYRPEDGNVFAVFGEEMNLSDCKGRDDVLPLTPIC